uniref:Uncharacterized protein AlNc14C211G8921 n=1 Tax=Albugo laibachii Nc14 TaxID=890382 RepID=F0WRB4_9STRA|nr:conserved hypothetical protein [Albugo laibachii Nc14]|eukprot:CCA23876.1 conserved hypothetical protein [Albugo laibachii Nc14]
MYFATSYNVISTSHCCAMTTAVQSDKAKAVLPTEFLDGKCDFIGAIISVTSSKGESIEGSVFTVDPVANLLILEERKSKATSKKKTHIFHLDALQQIKLVRMADAESESGLPHISEEELLRLEQRNKENAQRALASIGPGVSPEAQAIFDALNKTMPCQWDKQNIWVMREVVIRPPYDVKNCVSSDQAALGRVRKVLEGEKSRLKKAMLK